MEAIAAQPFFELVRSQCITTLYNNEMSFSLFGYPGSSWQLGGYLKRGFQDLDWLPLPPADASPPVSDVNDQAAHHDVEAEGKIVAAAETKTEEGAETERASALSSTLSSSPAFHRYGG